MKRKLTESANSGIGSGNLYSESEALVMERLVDEKGKVVSFLLREGNAKRCLHLVVVREKHSGGMEEEEEEEGMRKSERDEVEAILQKQKPR